MHTAYPCVATSRAVAAPMPRLPPVMIRIFFTGIPPFPDISSDCRRLSSVPYELSTTQRQTQSESRLKAYLSEHQSIDAGGHSNAKGRYNYFRDLRRLRVCFP